MLIGIDFDNTIICYDRVFHKVALDRGLIPDDMPVCKGSVRDYLREIGKEDEWTKLQGFIYGTRMNDAEPFPGIFNFLRFCKQKDIAVCIISHKTRYPYLGPRYDLHRAALQWMELQGFFASDKYGLSREHVFFEDSKDKKIERIIRLRCSHFIDDLPEFLSDIRFPERVVGILFDPNNNHQSSYPFQRVSSWKNILEILTKG